MATPAPHDAIPRPLLAAAAALIGFALLATAASRLLGNGSAVPADTGAAQSRALRFVDLDGGYVDVRDAGSDLRVALLRPGEDGFVRSTLRSLVRERRQRGIGDGPPFEVSVPGPRRVLLADPATGRRIELEAFGPTNAAAFARFATARPDDSRTEVPWKRP